MKQKYIVILFSALLFWANSIECIAQKRKSAKDQDILPPAVPIALEKELDVFNDGNTNAFYRIAIGADVPYNKKPMRVVYNSESGHVFLILQKISRTDTISKVFGFYPFKGVPIFFKRNVRSRIRDNSKRRYDVEISKMITEEQFKKAARLSLQYSKTNYHLNNFNCYDYTLHIYNAVAGTDTLPTVHVKFPLWYGRGGSPCGFYKYMKQQKESTSTLAPYIVFGNLVAPVSTKAYVAKKD